MAKGNKKKSKSPPATASKDTQNISIREASSFQGPLPPPRILHDYDQIVPGSAERIISLWENQVQHRQDLEKRPLILI